MLPDLPPTFAATRESLRALACFAISPARKARTGRIGLRPFDGGIATPPFEDGTRYAVRGDHLGRDAADPVPITTVAAATEYLGIEASPDPGVGHDLPPYAPDADLNVDPAASLALGAWYAYAQAVLDHLAANLPAGAEVTEAQIWPEHFDLAVTVTLPGDLKVNVGFSPGDGFHADPYAYVGPFDTSGLAGSDPFWNAPFGAYLPHAHLAAADDAAAAATQFIDEGLRRAGP